jgi:hypothetical protein
MKSALALKASAEIEQLKISVDLRSSAAKESF